MTTCALAQSLSDAEKRAVNELSGEMLECSVYFLVSAEDIRVEHSSKQRARTVVATGTALPFRAR